MARAVDFQIIANLMAGKGAGRKILSDLKSFLEDNHKTYDVLAIEKPTPISLLPGHNLTIGRGVICIGGDGTVSESVGYILNKKLDLPLAIIPAGTANIIASSFGMTGRERIFDFLLSNNYKKINVGLAEYGDKSEFFLLGFGLGFEENFLKMTKEKFKTKLGIFSYILTALSELLSLKKIPLKISIDGKQISVAVCTLMALNMPPKILKIFPLFKAKNSFENDGILDLSYVEYRNFIHSVLGTLALHVLGKFNFGTVRSFPGSEIYLQSDLIAGTQLDGELKGNLPVRLSLLPKLFSFLV